MRLRALDFIVCPACAGPLRLEAARTIEKRVDKFSSEIIAELRLSEDHFASDVAEGLLCCDRCHYLFALHDHVPRLFLYRLAASNQFMERNMAAIRALTEQGYRFPDDTPAPGEQQIQKAFSKEWGDYAYDGTIWATTPDGRLELALEEIGVPPESLRGKAIADIGSGNGVLSHMFASKVGMEVVGLDLSFAAVQAQRQFADNPLVNFVQGSIFGIPLRRGRFDVGYSSGVLHHTYDTRQAFDRAVPILAPGGTFYVWLYTTNRPGFDGFARRMNDGIRKVVSRLPFGLQDLVVYTVLTPVYWGGRAVLRPLLLGGETRRFGWRQALHAARDNYTPLYAHQHEPQDVVAWFREHGFAEVEPITPQQPPKSKAVPCSIRGRFPSPVSARQNVVAH
jgi:SAM-dependent methyltransferase/uncharacterized protein YbaR (Trm112 family)